MDFEWILELFWKLFWSKRRSELKKVILWKWAFRIDETLIFMILGHAFEGKNRKTSDWKMEWILEGIFDGFWLHFGGHFKGKKLQKSMPKFDEKMDAILEGIFGEFWE